MSRPATRAITTAAPHRQAFGHATSGAHALNTQTSNFGTVIAVYTGTSLSGLTAVACNDDFYGLQSRVLLAGVASTTYRVQIGSYGGTAGGNLVFNIFASAG